MIKIRLLDVARRIIQGMATRSSRCFQAVEEAARLRLMGVDTPNWEVLSAGLRPEEGRRVKQQPRHGWQKVASAKVTSNTGRKWCIGFGALHVIPNMSSDKNGVRALQSTPFKASAMPLPLSVRSCVWPSS